MTASAILLMNKVHTHQNGGRAAMTTLNGHYRKLIRDADGLTRRDPFINPPIRGLILPFQTFLF